MRPQHCARHHDGHDARRDPHRQACEMPKPHALDVFDLSHALQRALQLRQVARLGRGRDFAGRGIAALHLLPLLHLLLAHDAAQGGAAAAPARGVEQAQHGGRGPVKGPGPVGGEKQDADGDDVVARDAVVGVGQVDAGDGVGIAEGEEGRVREQQRRERVLGRAEVELREVVLLQAEDEEERDVGRARLREERQREEVV